MRKKAPPPSLYPPSVLLLHVHKVRGVQAAVHALLVACDAALDRDAAGRRPHDKVLQVVNLDGQSLCRGRPRAHTLLQLKAESKYVSH